jgi:hypothetical protein
MDILSILLFAAAVFALAVIGIFTAAFLLHALHRAGRRSLRHIGYDVHPEHLAKSAGPTKS